MHQSFNMSKRLTSSNNHIFFSVSNTQFLWTDGHLSRSQSAVSCLRKFRSKSIWKAFCGTSFRSLIFKSSSFDKLTSYLVLGSANSPRVWVGGVLFPERPSEMVMTICWLPLKTDVSNLPGSIVFNGFSTCWTTLTVISAENCLFFKGSCNHIPDNILFFVEGAKYTSTAKIHVVTTLFPWIHTHFCTKTEAIDAWISGFLFVRSFSKNLFIVLIACAGTLIHRLDRKKNDFPWLVFFMPEQCPYPVKLTRAKLPANPGNFTHGLHVKRPHTHNTCVTCSLPVKLGKFTRKYAASSSHRIQANCLQPHVNLSEYNGFFTGKFTCRADANFPATSMRNCLLLQAKIHAIGRQKHPQSKTKTRAIANKNTSNCSQYCYHTAGKITCRLQVRLHPAGEIKPKLRSWLRVVAFILREALATWMQVNLPVFTAEAHQGSFSMRLSACEISHFCR